VKKIKFRQALKAGCSAFQCKLY